MNCKQIESLLVDCLTSRPQDKMPAVVAEHLAHCLGCRRFKDSLQHTLSLLHRDRLVAPSPLFWEELQADTLKKVLQEKGCFTNSCNRPLPKWRRRRTLVAAVLLLLFTGAFLLVMLGQMSDMLEEIGGERYRLSNAFLMQGWDPSLLHVEITKAQLQKIYLKIEMMCKQRLQAYLHLDKKRMAALYPLIDRFGREAYLYGIKYTRLLIEMGRAIKSGFKSRLNKICHNIRQLEESWTLFRKHYLDDVSKVLNTEQYARFLFFTFQFRREILHVIMETCRQS